MNSPSLRIKVLNDPMYAENGMILSFRENGPCWIFDPGLPPQPENMLAYIEKEQLTPDAIILSHAHGDHIAGVDKIRETYNDVPLYLARQEWEMLSNPQENLSARFGVDLIVKAEPTHDLAPNLELTLDGIKWKVLDTSGHSPGGRSIYSEELAVALVGDAIFANSIGRVDFHYSNKQLLLKNLRENILTLPDNTVLIPGHGRDTTVESERRNNPYLK